MENRYPRFAGGRILKKESLWDLRDYAYGSTQLFYMDYTDGIIKGCRVRVEGNRLVIGKGILKCGDFIYLMQEEEAVPFEAENRLTVLKAAFTVKRGNPDYLAYQVSFFLDPDPVRKQGQIELCRFHLRTGSVLRDRYKDFSDMRTEYDTINLIHATVAGRGQERLHPEVMLRFAEEMTLQKGKQAVDSCFCYQILNTAGEADSQIVQAYLADKGEEDYGHSDRENNREWLYEKLSTLLGYETSAGDRHTGRKIILVE